MGLTRASLSQVFGEYGALYKVLAAFLEGLRMFRKSPTVTYQPYFLSQFRCVAAGSVMIREATEDTVLQIPNPVGEGGSDVLPIPKDLRVRLGSIF